MKFEAATGNDDSVAKGTMEFRRGADGWQWIVPTAVLDRMEAQARLAAPNMHNSKAPGWARNLAQELFVEKSEPGK